MATKFEIQHRTLCDGWVNTVWEYDDKASEHPVQFSTREEAEIGLQELFKDMVEHDMDLDVDEWRIQEVAVHD